jgi:hypothetical protein
LPFSPLVAVAGAAIVVIGLALLWPTRKRRQTTVEDSPMHSWQGSLDPPRAAGRMVGFILLVLAVVAGRLGSTQELRNVLPPLMVGAAWPLMVLLSVTLGPVWRWLDPWDGSARLVARDSPREDGSSVHLAAISALVLVWYLGVYPLPLAPRSVGLVLGAYALAMVGGCLALGRRSWLSRTEVFGLFFGWLARLPRGGLGRWNPPRGTEMVLGVIAGGLLFGAIRRTDLWGALNAVPGALAWATLGLVASCSVAAGVVVALARRGDRAGTPDGPEDIGASVAWATVPMVGAIAVAVAMARSRLFTSLSLVPRAISDPLGRGWDLFGTANSPVSPPLAEPTLAAVQLGVLLAGVAAAIFLLARLEPRNRIWGTLAVAFLACGGTMAVTLAPGVA